MLGIIGTALGAIFKSGVVDTVAGIGNVVDKFVRTPDDAAKLKLELENLVTERMKVVEESARTTVEARMEVTVAEIQSGDAYVRRTRPMVARWGLYIIIYNYCAVPLLGAHPALGLVPVELPTEFWVAWGGIVGTWSVGRSFERVTGKSNALIKAIAGT